VALGQVRHRTDIVAAARYFVTRITRAACYLENHVELESRLQKKARHGGRAVADLSVLIAATALTPDNYNEVESRGVRLE